MHDRARGRLTSDDVWVVVVVAALLITGVAVTLRGLSRTPDPVASTG